MKTRFEPRLPRMSRKNIKYHTLDLNSEPLHHEQVNLSLDHLSKTLLNNISSIQNYQGLLPVWQICSLNRSLHMSSFVGTLWNWLWWSNVIKLTTDAGVPWVRFLGVKLFFHANILGKLGSNLVFIVPFGTSYVEFGTEVWLVPFGIMSSKSQLDRSIFRIYIPNCEK